MKQIHYISLLLLAIIASACGSDEPFRHVVFADSPKMFSAVTDLSGSRSSSVITEGVSYNIVFNDEPRQATLTITDLQVDPAGERIIATFTDLEWTYEPGSHEKQRIIRSDELHSSGSPAADVVLTDVTIIYTESNEMNPNATAGFYAEYTVNGSYYVISYPYSVLADGTTTVRGVAVGDPAIDEVFYDPVYAVSFDPATMTATLVSDGLVIDGEAADFELTGLRLGLDGRSYSLSTTPATRFAPADGNSRWHFRDFNAKADLRDELNFVLELADDSLSVVVEGFLSPDLSTPRP